MQVKLSSYALVGIDAVPVDVIVDGHQVKVVVTRSRQVLHSVRLQVPDARRHPIGSSAHQGTPGKRAPTDLKKDAELEA
jgi:hypothetical protein